MILVDFSHLAMRNLFTSVYNAKPKKENGKFITSQYIGLFYHQMLNSLDKINNEFNHRGDKEIILAFDDKWNWRKNVLLTYKGHRKKNREESEVNFDEFFEQLEELKEQLTNNFGYKGIQVKNAEADDIIFVLAEKFKEKAIVITSDKDMKVVLKYGCKLFDPIKDTYVNLDEKELDHWLKLHILIGDASDGIPNIKWNTHFTPEFEEYLRENGFYGTELDFANLPFEEKEKLIENFDVYYKNKKGEPTEKMLYKKTRFGEKTASKLIPLLDSYFSKEEREKDYRRELEFQNFKLNKQLIHPSGIPEDIKQAILDAYENSESKINEREQIRFLKKYNLRERLNKKNAFFF